jgi:hypothetical protein
MIDTDIRPRSTIDPTLRSRHARIWLPLAATALTIAISSGVPASAVSVTPTPNNSSTNSTTTILSVEQGTRGDASNQTWQKFDVDNNSSPHNLDLRFITDEHGPRLVDVDARGLYRYYGKLCVGNIGGKLDVQGYSDGPDGEFGTQVLVDPQNGATTSGEVLDAQKLQIVQGLPICGD